MNIRFISAGAGSGKTYRLTEILSERLTDVAEPARPEAVIATTFTRKAAGELVDRVRQKLIEKAWGNTNDQNPTNGMQGGGVDRSTHLHITSSETNGFTGHRSDRELTELGRESSWRLVEIHGIAEMQMMQ